MRAKSRFCPGGHAQSENLVCHDNGRDIYGRTLAHCFIGAQDIQHPW